ncbi:ABC-2 transporter permease [Pueribacillus theae]|uniref:ABC-2 transporter permease n=1 Tax=Pueribacillus theae TaxID=2171751 RepID=UPI0014034D59|nr:ABC-2 transporter permease [Pueribacillus theae]
MKALILKDLYTQKVYIYFFSMMWFVIVTNFFTDGSPFRHVLLLTILAFWLASSTNANTKSFEGESVLINSLPITRRQIVLAKYTSGLMWFAFAAIAVLVYIFLFDTFAPFPTRMMHVDEFILSLSGYYILLSVFYPILFQAGYHISSIVTFVFAFVVSMGIRIFHNMVENPGLTFMPGIVETLESNATLLMFVFIAFSIFITLISYGLSVRIYERKDF